MEGLFDGRSQAAESQLAVDLDHLLDDLDEDGDADRVDDLRPRQVQEEGLVALVEELVGGLGDLLAPLVVDIPLRVDYRQPFTAIHGDVEAFGHRLAPHLIASFSSPTSVRPGAKRIPALP